MKRPSFALLAFFIAFAALGALVGLGLNGKLNGLIGFFSSDVVIYQDSTRLNETQQYQVLSWDALLPEAEKVLLGKAQSTQLSLIHI